MKNIFAGILIMLVIAAEMVAQPLPAVRSLNDYWPVGEVKEYPLVFADTVPAGSYRAEMVDTDDSQGLRQYKIEEEYKIKFPGVFPGSNLDIDGRLQIDEAGFFQAVEIDVDVDGRRQKLTAYYDADSAKVFASWGEGEQAGSRVIETGGPIFACDNNMIAQLEIIMAVHDLIPKEAFTARALSLQRLYLADFEFFVEGKVLSRYGAYIDSVWQVNLVRPVRQTFFVDQRHKIVKFQDFDQKVSAEYKRDPFAERSIKRKTETDFFSTHISRLPIYVIFLAVVAVWAAIFSRRAFGSLQSYLFFIIGTVSYALIFVTQLPLHELYSMKVLYPVIKEGRSVIIYGIVPSLITAVFQQSFKLLPLLALVQIKRPAPAIVLALGAFVGAGFGFVEAANALGPLFQNQNLTATGIIERVFSTMFHVASGALIAYGVVRYKIWQFWVLTIALQFLMVYSLFFHKIVSFEFLHVWQIIIAVSTLATAKYFHLKFDRKLSKSKKSKR